MPQACNIMRPAPCVGRNGKLRIIALVSCTQEFVAVCLKKAQAQRIPWFCMPQACNITRPAPRVGRNGKLRVIALGSCTQKFVAVCLKKAQAQRIPWFRMPQACYILRRSVRVGPNGNLRVSTLASYTLTFVPVRFKTAWAHGVRRAHFKERPPVDTCNSTDARASLGGAGGWHTRHDFSQATYLTHVMCSECGVSGGAL